MLKKNNFDSSRTYIVKVLLAVFFVLVVILPLVKMLSLLFRTDVSAVVHNPRFVVALKNSLVSTLVATIHSVILAYILAMCVYRTQMKHKTIITVLVTLPMLIPSVSHGMGLILLCGSNGFLTNLFNVQESIYGFAGVVVGSIMYSFPVAFLMIADILKYQDYTPYEACKVMNIRLLDHIVLADGAYFSYNDEARL